MYNCFPSPVTGTSLPKESIVKFLVVDGEFPHLWPHPLSRLLFQALGVFLLLQSLSHLHDPRGLERERERDTQS